VTEVYWQCFELETHALQGRSLDLERFNTNHSKEVRHTTIAYLFWFKFMGKLSVTSTGLF